MEIGWVGREALPVFQSLLLPGAAAEAERGDSVTVLGAEEDGVACGAADAGEAEDVMFLPKIMARKKQVTPMLAALWG